MMTTAGFIITAIVTFIGGAGGAGLFQWLSKRRDQSLAERKDARDGALDSVAIVNSWREQAKSSAEDAAAAREEARKAREDMASMRRDVDALLDRVGVLEAELGASEGDRMALAGYLTVVVAGIEAHTVPPLPTPPPVVASIMSRITRTTEQEKQ